MQRNQRSRNSSEPLDSSGIFGMGKSLLSNFLEKDPFDDPFFTRPFGSIFDSSSIFNLDRFFGNSFGHKGGFLENRTDHALEDGHRRPVIIEEVSDVDDKHGAQIHIKSDQEPIVEYPDDEDQEYRRNQTSKGQDQGQSKRLNQRQHQNVYQSSNLDGGQCVSESYCFQSSSVRYGGPDGAYYTSSTTRRAGPDGVIEEKHQEEDSTTGNATSRITRGIHDKAHSVMKKRNPDGRVETTETLHNLKDGEVEQFDETWEKRAQKSLLGWNKTKVDLLNSGHKGTTITGHSSKHALPSTQFSTKRNGEHPCMAKSVGSSCRAQLIKDPSASKCFGRKKA